MTLSPLIHNSPSTTFNSCIGYGKPTEAGLYSLTGLPETRFADSVKPQPGKRVILNGLYSLTTNKWIDEPKKLKPLDNDVAVKAKYKEFVEAAKNVKDGEVANDLIQKIKRMRKAGLAKEGEFSVENLVFKKLRNEGVIGKLMDIRKED